MRLPLLITTLLLGSLQALPLQALSYDLSELSHQADGELTSNAVSRDWVAGRPGPRQNARSRNQSSANSPKSQSQSRPAPSRAQSTQRRSQPSPAQSRPRPTTRRAQPAKTQPRPNATVRRSQPKAVQSSSPRRLQSKPSGPQPKTNSSKPAVIRKTPATASPKAPTSGVKTGVRKRPQPQSPSNSRLRKIRKAPAQTSNPKVATPKKVKKQPISSPSIQQKGLTSSPPRPQKNSKPVVRQQTAPKSPPNARQRKNKQLIPTAVKGIKATKGKSKVPSAKVQKPIKPAVTVKKVPSRGGLKPAKAKVAPINRAKIRRAKSPSSHQRRAIRRQRYKSGRYWGNRRVQTRRLTRSYRPCYYCPGQGWSYSPTCYTRPSRYYIYSDSLSYWPSWSTSTRYSRRSDDSYSTEPTLNRDLQEQVEIAIQDYAELYNLAVLNDDIDVSQEGSIIILTGVVDQEETLEDLIAIARDIDGVKYVIADDVIVRELEGEGVFEEESLTFDSVPAIGNSELNESLDPSIDEGGVVERWDSSRDTFPSILREELLEDQLETSLPDLELIAAVTEFLPSALQDKD